MVEVAYEHSDDPPVASRRVDGVLRELVERAPVREPGERIGPREARDLLERGGELLCSLRDGTLELIGARPLDRQHLFVADLQLRLGRDVAKRHEQQAIWLLAEGHQRDAHHSFNARHRAHTDLLEPRAAARGRRLDGTIELGGVGWDDEIKDTGSAFDVGLERPPPQSNEQREGVVVDLGPERRIREDGRVVEA